MKNLALAILITLSVPVFAQRNEIGLSGGAVRYHGQRMPGAAHHLDGYGSQFALCYRRNFQWLQLAAGIEAGRWSEHSFRVDVREPWGHQDVIGYATARQTLANPFVAPVLQANVYRPGKRWNFYGGIALGYYRSTVRHSYTGLVIDPPYYSSTYDHYRVEITARVKESLRPFSYTQSGFLAGLQAGGSYKFQEHLALSGGISFRSAAIDRTTRPHHPEGGVFYRVIYWGVALGIDYVF